MSTKSVRTSPNRPLKKSSRSKSIRNWADLKAELESSYDIYSRSHKKISDMILHYPHKAAVMTIRELAQELSCSEGTILRFCERALSGGYSDLVTILRRYVRTEWTSLDRLELAAKETGKTRNAHPILSKSAQLSISNIERTFAGVSKESFEETVNLLRNAEGITVVGQRSSFSIAFYFNFLLQGVHPQSRLLDQGMGTFSYDLNQRLDDEVFVIFLYTRYTRWVCDIGEAMAKAGHPIILFTDSDRCPLWELATVTFETHTESLHHTLSIVPAMALLNALTSALVASGPSGIRKRLGDHEKLLKQLNVFTF